MAYSLKLWLMAKLYVHNKKKNGLAAWKKKGQILFRAHRKEEGISSLEKEGGPRPCMYTLERRRDQQLEKKGGYKGVTRMAYSPKLWLMAKLYCTIKRRRDQQLGKRKGPRLYSCTLERRRDKQLGKRIRATSLCAHWKKEGISSLEKEEVLRPCMCTLQTRRDKQLGKIRRAKSLCAHWKEEGISSLGKESGTRPCMCTLERRRDQQLGKRKRDTSLYVHTGKKIQRDQQLGKRIRATSLYVHNGKKKGIKLERYREEGNSSLDLNPQYRVP